jgi:glutathione S-transferase
MSALKVYGIPQSRAARVLWMVEECGAAYELVSTHYSKEAKTEAYRSTLNPNGRVPTIDDGGVIVWESMAINLYLAKKYGADLAPKNLAEEAHALQWSFWVMTEVEKAALAALIARSAKDDAQAAKALDDLRGPLGVLNGQLGKSEYLLGSRFTVADLNVASVLNWVTAARLNLAEWPKVEAWLAKCQARPAAQKARAIR